MNKTFLKVSLLLVILALITMPVSASYFNPSVTVTAPATAASTSGYYTITWTTTNVLDTNSISCYADNDGSGQNQTYTILSALSPDLNKYYFDTQAWTGRYDNKTYYLWCQIDQNTLAFDYSAAALTVTNYAGGDVGNIVIDVAGGLLYGLMLNAGTVGIIFVVIIILVVLMDVLTGTIGIIALFKDLTQRR